MRLHAVVEDAREQHMAQRHLQLFGLEVRIPGTDGAPLVIEHAHHLPAEVLNLADGVPWRRGGSRRPPG